MKIAMLSPIAWSTPPKQYGPWEQIVSLLTEGLVKQGFDVTLFATKDSRTQGKLHAICPRPYEEDKNLDPKVWECLHISEVYEMADEFDLIHNHFDFPPLCYTKLVDTPVVTTIHGFSSPRILPVYQKYNNQVFYVSISDADRNPTLNYIATVHHGIDINSLPFNNDPEDYLLFLGRIHPDKGVREAIEIAKKAGRKLLIAGPIHDKDYYQKEVKPLLNGSQIKYLGHVDRKTRNRLLSHATALLHPINFKEPFGLVVVESMACGTPVIANNRGAMPELIRDGENGFLVNNTREAVEALEKVPGIPRKRCREIAEKHFSADRMVEDYIRVYNTILAERQREDHRPWGFYQVLADQPDHKIKRIIVYPGKRLSLQRHQRRSEHWQIIKGKAIVTRDNQEIELHPGASIDIPRGAIHRIANPGQENLVFIEIQLGDYFGEDDIERIEDDYGRTTSPNL